MAAACALPFQGADNAALGTISLTGGTKTTNFAVNSVKPYGSKSISGKLVNNLGGNMMLTDLVITIKPNGTPPPGKKFVPPHVTGGNVAQQGGGQVAIPDGGPSNSSTVQLGNGIQNSARVNVTITVGAPTLGPDDLEPSTFDVLITPSTRPGVGDGLDVDVMALLNFSSDGHSHRSGGIETHGDSAVIVALKNSDPSHRITQLAGSYDFRGEGNSITSVHLLDSPLGNPILNATVTLNSHTAFSISCIGVLPGSSCYCIVLFDHRPTGATALSLDATFRQ